MQWKISIKTECYLEKNGIIKILNKNLNMSKKRKLARNAKSEQELGMKAHKDVITNVELKKENL